MVAMLCDNCGKREATDTILGAKASGEPWTLHLCAVCAPEPGEPPTEEEFERWLAAHPEEALTDEELDAQLRQFSSAKQGRRRH